MEPLVPHRGRVFLKIARLFGIALRLLFTAWLDQRAWSYTEGESRKEREIKRARWLREQLVSLGPTFIKIGQALSTRVDMLPVTYVDEMAQLQDRIPAFDTALARRFVEEELGHPVDEIFHDFPASPIAAASLGQVYHTWLHTGEEVAVKVQRPDLLVRFAEDLSALRFFARLIESRTRFFPGLELVDILDEFDLKLHEEVDYRLEAANTERFAVNFLGYPDVLVPRVYPGYSSRRVLTMTFMHGTKVTNLDVLNDMKVDVPRLVRQASQVNLKQLLEDGFYHADLHPGNILVDRQGRLIFLDFGLVGELTRPMRLQLVEAFLHIVDGDVDGLMADMAVLGFIRPGQDPAPLKPTLAWIIDAALRPFAKRPTFKEMTDPLAEIFHRYHLRVPVTFSWIIRTLISLEGIAMHLDPEFHPFDVAIPFAAKLIVSEAGRDIRDRFIAEIFKPGGLDWDRLFELLKLARRDPGFKMGEVATVGMEWLAQPEARALRARVLDEFLGDAPIPWERLEALLQLIQQDPSFDWLAVSKPLVNFFLTRDGAPFRQKLVWKMGKDLLAGRLGEWAGIYKVARAIL